MQCPILLITFDAHVAFSKLNNAFLRCIHSILGFKMYSFQFMQVLKKPPKWLSFLEHK